MVKQCISLVVILILAVGMASPIHALENQSNFLMYQGISFDFDFETGTITSAGLFGDDYKVVFPSSIHGVKVTAIRDGIYYLRSGYRKNEGSAWVYGDISAVILPENLVSIGNYVLNRTRISEIVIPKDVHFITQVF